MNKRLYVSGLTNKATEATLQALFSKAGTVESAEIVTDKATGYIQGYGFVVMSTESEANQAVTLLDGIIFQGHSLIIYPARPRIVRNQPLPEKSDLTLADVLVKRVVE